jgi:hypothetical protein
MEQQAEFGPRLQAFINAKIISEAVARELPPNQRQAIENLSSGQVGTIIEVHNAVGPIMVPKFI